MGPPFLHSRPYNESTLAEAASHVQKMKADLGGTELESALRFVLEQPRHGAMARQVVVLTDGHPVNRRGHSWRIATTGSTSIARRAGT